MNNLILGTWRRRSITAVATLVATLGIFSAVALAGSDSDDYSGTVNSIAWTADTWFTWDSGDFDYSGSNFSTATPNVTLHEHKHKSKGQEFCYIPFLFVIDTDWDIDTGTTTEQRAFATSSGAGSFTLGSCSGAAVYPTPGGRNDSDYTMWDGGDNDTGNTEAWVATMFP